MFIYLMCSRKMCLF